MKIYNRLPIFAQNMACFFVGTRIQHTRYNAKFWKVLKEYEERNDWSYEQLCEFRDKRLRNMVKHCYETVPYYTKLFDQYGINYENIKTIDDLKALPILTKAIVKDNFKDFISQKVDKKEFVNVHTSGTTGSGFHMYCTMDTIHEQWAAFWRCRRNLGIDFGNWCALMGGRSVVPVEQKKPPFWRINSPCKQIYFSAYHMNEDNIESYISEIEKRKIEWIHGYPSSINLIAQYMNSHNRKLSHSVRFVTTGAENLLQAQKENIYNAFGVNPYEHYGQTENVAIFSERKDHKLFVDEDFSVVEFIMDPNINMYKIVGTSLNNYAMPLLRYEIGDIAEVKESNEGREVVSIDGRKEDYVVLSNGSKVGRLDHIFKDMVNISEAQIVQKRVGEITIKIVKGNQYTSKDEERLLYEIHQRIGESEKIYLEYVETIPRTQNGKLRFVISEV